MDKPNVVYTAHASATGGRDGRAVSSDNVIDLKLSVPKEMGGGGGADLAEIEHAAIERVPRIHVAAHDVVRQVIDVGEADAMRLRVGRAEAAVMEPFNEAGFAVRDVTFSGLEHTPRATAATAVAVPNGESIFGVNSGILNGFVIESSCRQC